jgi:hypothetical protein
MTWRIGAGCAGVAVVAVAVVVLSGGDEGLGSRSEAEAFVRKELACPNQPVTRVRCDPAGSNWVCRYSLGGEGGAPSLVRLSGDHPDVTTIC